jgi:hypothetical protein
MDPISCSHVNAASAKLLTASGHTSQEHAGVVDYKISKLVLDVLRSDKMRFLTVLRKLGILCWTKLTATNIALSGMDADLFPFIMLPRSSTEV